MLLIISNLMIWSVQWHGRWWWQLCVSLFWRKADQLGLFVGKSNSLLTKKKNLKKCISERKEKIKFKEYYQLGLFVGKLGKLGEFPSLLSSPAPAQKLNVKSAPVKFPIFNHMPIRDICPFFSSNTIFGLIFLHAKKRKLWQNWFRDKTA